MISWHLQRTMLGSRFFTRLQQEWKCSDVETVDQTNWVRFCGFELKRYGDGVSLMVGQKSYNAELLKRHEGVTPKTCPMLKSEHEEPLEENLTTENIRAAQTITGELLWLAGRSIGPTCHMWLVPWVVKCRKD